MSTNATAPGMAALSFFAPNRLFGFALEKLLRSGTQEVSHG